MAYTYQDAPFSLEEGREYLRVDINDHDSEIQGYLSAIGPYLKETTGYEPDTSTGYSPLAQLAGKFLLWLWYYGEDSDVYKVYRTLNCLLSAIRQPRQDASDETSGTDGSNGEDSGT